MGAGGTRAFFLTHHAAPGAVARSPPYKSRDNESDSMAGTPMGRLVGKPCPLASILLHTFPSGRAGATLQTTPLHHSQQRPHARASPWVRVRVEHRVHKTSVPQRMHKKFSQQPYFPRVKIQNKPHVSVIGG